MQISFTYIFAVAASLIAQIVAGDTLLPSNNSSSNATPSPIPTPISTSSSCPKPSGASQNSFIGIAAGFCAVALALVGAIISGRKQRKEIERRERERLALQRSNDALKEDYEWLYQATPEPVRRTMDARKRARVTTMETTFVP